MALVVGRGPLKRSPPAGYLDREGRPVRVHLGVRSRLVELGMVEPDSRGWLRATPAGKANHVCAVREDHLVRVELPHLGVFGSPNDQLACSRLLTRHLPGREVVQIPHRAKVPWVGGTAGVWTLRSDGRRGRLGKAPDGVAVVVARFVLAATVVLIVEEHLRFEREPPVALLAPATLCLADGTVLSVPGEPLTSEARP